MPAPRNLVPSALLNLALPADLRGRLDLHLYDEAERRIPKGAHQRFFIARILEFFEWGVLDLGAYGLPPGSIVKGPRAVLELLQRRLSVQS